MHATLGAGETFPIFTDLHQALKDMIAVTAFKFIDRHGKFLLTDFSQKISTLRGDGSRKFGTQKKPRRVIPPGF